MIFLYTDYGPDLYPGQLESALRKACPNTPILHLCANAPRHNPRAAAYLLAACCTKLPPESILLGIVDPGVGTWEDPPLILRLAQCWYLGPDNGLFDILRRRDETAPAWRPSWRPEHPISPSFHGRDLYAPLASRIATGWHPPEKDRASPRAPPRAWPDQLPEILYIDHFGNALSGLQASTYSKQQRFLAGMRILPHAETFGSAPRGTPFWYQNSIGLVEVAVNQGSAAALLGLDIGSPLLSLPPSHTPQDTLSPPPSPR